MIVAALLALPAAAFAHHSFAMFDMSKTTQHTGKVKEVQWTNPHVWVELEVTVEGKPTVLSFEAAAIAVLKRAGWFRDTVKAGDTITIIGHPFRDGRPGGAIDHLVLSDGRRIGAGDAIPPALVVPGVAAPAGDKP
nr:MAG: hypothetical protein DIU62_12600 [Pseudomonadota bacterium]